MDPNLISALAAGGLYLAVLVLGGLWIDEMKHSRRWRRVAERFQKNAAAWCEAAKLNAKIADRWEQKARDLEEMLQRQEARFKSKLSVYEAFHGKTDQPLVTLPPIYEGGGKPQPVTVQKLTGHVPITMADLVAYDFKPQEETAKKAAKKAIEVMEQQIAGVQIGQKLKDDRMCANISCNGHHYFLSFRPEQAAQAMIALNKWHVTKELGLCDGHAKFLEKQILLGAKLNG